LNAVPLAQFATADSMSTAPKTTTTNVRIALSRSRTTVRLSGVPSGLCEAAHTGCALPEKEQGGPFWAAFF